MGDPVTAEDRDADDVLTYTLADDSGKFVIDRATGQISVAKKAKFNVTMTISTISVGGHADSYMSPSLPQTLRAYQPKPDLMKR